MPDKIIIYTDGACTGNPGHGGYGAVMIKGDLRKELSEGYRFTTNNRMEMKAVVVALQAVKDRTADIELHTDSRLIVDAIEKDWLSGWKRRSWRKADKKPVLNADLWMRIDGLLNEMRVRFKWVKGHAGIEENERCDELATWEAEHRPFKIDNVYERENPPSRKILNSYQAKLDSSENPDKLIKPESSGSVQNKESIGDNSTLKIGRTEFSHEIRDDGKIVISAGSKKLPPMTENDVKSFINWIKEISSV